mmetsp:Transcript_9295/g.27931  ORF Transcript_9295/g.27931 Transcript_9295/m.27931 type:complete len:209 (-) Transcript_9295:2219-2845(-)
MIFHPIHGNWYPGQAVAGEAGGLVDVGAGIQPQLGACGGTGSGTRHCGRLLGAGHHNARYPSQSLNCKATLLADVAEQAPVGGATAVEGQAPSARHRHVSTVRRQRRMPQRPVGGQVCRGRPQVLHLEVCGASCRLLSHQQHSVRSQQSMCLTAGSHGEVGGCGRGAVQHPVRPRQAAGEREVQQLTGRRFCCRRRCRRGALRRLPRR